MKRDYVLALLALIEDEIPIETALLGLKIVLKKRRHQKLLLPILRQVLLILVTKKGSDEAQVVIAGKNADGRLLEEIKIALLKLGIHEDTTIKEKFDETLVGGFVATYNYREYDYSYKRILKSLHESITA